MEILARAELEYRRREFIDKIKAGALFVYPTDTIYGLGCNALKQRSVQKIRELKRRQTTPLSIWVPSIDWIRKYCVISPKAEAWLQKLPGPYTLILSLKENHPLAKNVTPNKTISVRLPDHWFQVIVEECGFPIITTSANKTGEPFMTSLENLDPDLEQNVEFMIYEGEKDARPSKIINVEKEEVKER